MDKITTIIIEDEEASRETLRNYLTKYCPQVEILAESKDIIEGQAAIEKHQPDFIFLDVEPSFIDINIHPTKTEIKFEDERSIGMLMRSAIKQSIGMFNVSPTIDFNPENSFATTPLPKGKIFTEPKISVNQNFNPFDSSNSFSKTPSKDQIQGLQSMY